MICKKCGTEFEGTFCPNCGEPVEKRISECPVCGKKRKGEEKFCTRCGCPYDRDAFISFAGEKIYEAETEEFSKAMNDKSWLSYGEKKKQRALRLYNVILTSGTALFGVLTFCLMLLPIMRYAGYGIDGDAYNNSLISNGFYKIQIASCMLRALASAELLYFAVRLVKAFKKPYSEMCNIYSYVIDGFFSVMTFVFSLIIVADAGNWMADAGIGMILIMVSGIVAAIALVARIVFDFKKKEYFSVAENKQKTFLHDKKDRIKKVVGIAGTLIYVAFFVVMAIYEPIQKYSKDYTRPELCASVLTLEDTNELFGAPNYGNSFYSDYYMGEKYFIDEIIYFLGKKRSELAESGANISYKSGKEAEKLEKKINELDSLLAELNEKTKYASYKHVYFEFEEKTGEFAYGGQYVVQVVSSYYCEVINYDGEELTKRTLTDIETFNGTIHEYTNIVSFDYVAKYDDGSFIKGSVEEKADENGVVRFSDQLGDYSIEASKFEKKSELLQDCAYVENETLYVYMNPTIDINDLKKSYTIKNIVIGDSVTEIPEFAFNNMKDLQKVEIGSGLKSIPASAFKDCDLLKEVNFSESVTSIEKEAFSGCNSLVTITLPSRTTSIGESAFYGCSMLKNVVASEVNEIGKSAFRDCKSLQNISISEVSVIGKSAFKNCISLDNVVLSEKVAIIEDEVFRNCTSLKKITLSENIESIGDYAFYSCSSLSEIIIPEKTKDIGVYAFGECNALISAMFNNNRGWTVSVSSAGSEKIFLSTAELTNVNNSAKYLTSKYCSYYWKCS